MFFSIIILLILLYTNWLPAIEKDFQCSRRMIAVLLLIIFFFHWMPDLAFRPSIHIDGGLLIMMFVCLYFFYHLDHKIAFLSILLSSTSIAFSFHEVYHIHTDWTLLSFRLLMIFLFVVMGFVAFDDPVKQVLYLWSGCFITNGLILYAHQEMLNPIVMGEPEFMDFCWMAMILQLLFNYGMKPLYSRIRNGY